MDVIERFMQWIDVQDDHWMWTGQEGGKGEYGLFFYEGRNHPAHRVAYILFVEEILEGLVIDHLCRIHLCVNPKHLEPVTQKVNVLRGANGGKTHCKYNHEFTEENTYTNTRGQRECRTCARAARRRFDERKKALQL
jgi:hypothetical protein